MKKKQLMNRNRGKLRCKMRIQHVLFPILCLLSCDNPIVTDILPVNPRLLWGSVVISGNNWVDETLTADTSKLGGSGAITYQWKRGNINIGTNSSTYTIETTDAGTHITVIVSRADNSGTVTSNAVTAVDKTVTVDSCCGGTGFETGSQYNPTALCHVQQSLDTILQWQ